jgi:adenine-specific DNA-methyltransferase
MPNYKGNLELKWVNKDKSLLYEINEEESMGTKPRWIGKDDIRVSEPRNLKLVKEFGDPDNENMLIRGDNLLALRSLLEIFKNREEKDKVKCIYIDPPFNTGSAFEQYDDNLEHSQWLTMMRDRLILLKQLLREDGAIFVHIDDSELGYLLVLMDEIFGRQNYICICTVRRSSATGHKAINPGPMNTSDYVIGYAKSKNQWTYQRLFTQRERDRSYSKYIVNSDKGYEDWEFIPLNEAFCRLQGFASLRTAKKKMGEEFDEKLNEFVIANAKAVVQFATPNYRGVSKEARKLIDQSREEKNKVFLLKRKNYLDMYFFNGKRVLFYIDKLKEINGEVVPGEPLTTIWTDIPMQALFLEGGVSMRKGKKPEKLIKRILEMNTNLGDVVFDSFLGSGTTAAVSHKLGRRWIGIEMGKHAETLCIPRLRKVISGEDQTGISKEVGWGGGGGFRYYAVGESLVRDSDINWDLTYEEIARALFMMFDYSFVGKLEDEIYVGRRKGKYALSIASKNLDIVAADVLDDIVEKVKRNHENIAELDIYTNKGVGVKEEDLPEGVSIKKIPESVLRKYRL